MAAHVQIADIDGVVLILCFPTISDLDKLLTSMKAGLPAYSTNGKGLRRQTALF